MIPTRTAIQEKINELKQEESDIYEGIITWLNEIECPDADKQKILEDLISYGNYR
jgi:hypothetical protein